ncbi:hypothetical protein H8K90_08240 [Winogradskyella echinorum]|uniref:Uncharacterized protein n=1 Tax=Winogradskyella echinorum TaxID=538189 RepID=A0ABR6Y279_9FLAO|nr:hypothetical protein [Winogradskyella echinorum]MBC3846365.1 hypothetical protein [Winogradskyella echinorum]MBC5750713.1 hypothetical protein [Winogradskyella echinorum]
MEQLDIQKLWKQSEALLEENRTLNLALLKELKLSKAKSSLNRLLFLPISTLVFYIILGFYAIYFAVNHSEQWYFAFSGVVVTFFSFWFVIVALKQLYLILSIDYTEAVIKIQKTLAELKTSVIQNLRIAAWLLPFGPFIAVFFFKVIFNVDVMSLLNFNMLISFGISTVILEIISLFLLRALHPKRLSERWLNWLLQGNGSQVIKALQYLDAIQEFKKNKI